MHTVREKFLKFKLVQLQSNLISYNDNDINSFNDTVIEEIDLQPKLIILMVLIIILLENYGNQLTEVYHGITSPKNRISNT